MTWGCRTSDYNLWPQMMGIADWLWTDGGWQCTLLYMQLSSAESPQQTSEGWQLFNRLYLTQSDLDFIKRILWKKTAHRGTDGTLGGE